ncbi:MAG: purine permease [Oscillospiraceae bacterium]|nr:purine permease [Oscillospiraceae bacterium]
MRNKAETKSAPVYTDPYTFRGRIPLKHAIPLGIQHVLAMFVGNLTPLIIICGACGLIADEPALYVSLLQNAMLVAGLVTLVQLFSIGPIGGQVPIIMGTSSGFLGVMRSVAGTMGGGVLAYGAILGASIIGGLLETVLGFFIKPLRRLFPPVVTGSVVLAIGLSLISVGVNSFAGGNTAADFGSLENLFVGFLVLVVIVVLKHATKGITSTASILFGILFGYILCAVMALILPTTAVSAEGAAYTKAWVLNWAKIQDAAWFSLPALLPVKPVFEWGAIIPIGIMFIVTAVETVGDTAGCIEGGMDREATDKELSGAVTCDGIGSSFAALFGVLPNTSFSQNVGLVAMTKVVNRFALSLGAVFLVLCGLSPKLAAVISIMPQSVLGGAAVMMFSSIAISGIQLITKHGVTPRIITIVSVALGVGYGLGATAGSIAGLGENINLVFGGSGIVPAALLAILLNLLIPKGPEDLAAETAADHLRELKAQNMTEAKQDKK